jgi:hypothetical protein
MVQISKERSKNNMRRSSLILSALILSVSSYSYARINILDPFHPGQDSTIGSIDSYQAIATFKKGDGYTELPVQFTYIPTEKLEAGGSWGIKSVNGQTGINDLMAGIKYQFLNGQGEKPAVIGEVAASLPTADSNKGLGLGASALWFHWALEKKFDDVVGYFGIGLGAFGENGDKIKQGNVFYYHIGTSMPYKNKYRIHTEIKGFNHGHTQFNGVDVVNSYQELYLAPGVNYFWKKKHTLSASLLFGLTSDSNKLGLFLASTF